MARRWERADLTPAQQYMLLKNSVVSGGKGSIDSAGLTWKYKDRPTPLSREYTVIVEYWRGDDPRVFVKDPDIAALAGDRADDIPHVYRNPLRLCLYLPGSGEWDGTMRLDRTFVPWASVWLYYFEDWLGSNEWKGGGIHPNEHRVLPKTLRERRKMLTSR